MDDVLTTFVNVLRDHGVRISTAETIDAAETIALLGYDDREVLRDALAAALAKSFPEKQLFHECFDRFFSFTAFNRKETPREAYGRRPGENDALSPLSLMLLSGDQAGLMASLAAAGEMSNLNGIALFTQKSMFQRRILEAMGLEALDGDLARLQADGSDSSGRLATALAGAREYCAEEVRRFVDSQHDLHAKARMEALMERRLLHLKLSDMEARDFNRMDTIIRKMVKRINDVHSRRKKRWKRGFLDLKKTLRKNITFDEVPFHLRWKRRKIERPDVIVLCDISRSMQKVVRFFLLFLYSLNRTVVRIRSFAFCSNLAEVSPLFDRYGVEEAVARLQTGHDLDIWMGRTDYGQVFRDFAANYLHLLSDRTTVIILGDGRNNFGGPEARILKTMGERSKRIVWLNPEPPTFWGTGDSAMKQYLPFCSLARECNTLFQLERAIDSLLK